MGLKLPIKIVYDFDEEIYYVFVEQLSIEGSGITEQEAVADFFVNLDKEMKE